MHTHTEHTHTHTDSGYAQVVYTHITPATSNTNSASCSGYYVTHSSGYVQATCRAPTLPTHRQRARTNSAYTQAKHAHQLCPHTGKAHALTPVTTGTQAAHTYTKHTYRQRARTAQAKH